MLCRVPKTLTLLTRKNFSNGGISGSGKSDKGSSHERKKHIKRKRSSKTCVQDTERQCTNRETQAWSSNLALKRCRLRLVLLGGSLLGSLLGLGLFSSLALGSLVLHVLIIDTQGLIDLGAESLLVIKPSSSKLVGCSIQKSK